MFLLLPFSLSNQKILELEKEVQEGAAVHQRLADLQEQLRILQEEKKRIVSYLKEREAVIAKCSMYGSRTMNIKLHCFRYIT
jgi:hypothetical protein